MILDGGNRYRACVEAGVNPLFVEFAGGNLVSFVLSANLHRRHMSAGQQAAIVASAQDWAKAQTAGSNQHRAKASGGPATLPDQLATVSQRAAESGASERTQRMADKVAKADPALAVKVAHGEVSLPKAHAQVSVPKPAPAPVAAPVSAAAFVPAPAASKAQHVADEAMPDGPSLEELIDELQAENKTLQAVVQAAQADDLKAEAMKWRRIAEQAQRRQSELMQTVADREKELQQRHRILTRICKAAGEQDPAKVAAVVEAFYRQHSKATA
jgi:hypothetical protein